MTDTLTLSEASALADIIRAVESGAKLEYYPDGADSADRPVTCVMRAFTHDGGGFIAPESDVRDAHVWTSGMFEHWYPVRVLIQALRNISGEFGLDQPIAIIR